MTKPTVFIDGEAGTTGLQIRDRLAARTDIERLSIDPDKRKDNAARAEMLNGADVAILCLPDDAARQAANLVTNPDTVIIDASSAHRTHPDWTYGFPEMAGGQRERIAASRRISNPGCYPTGFIALVRPLVAEGIVPATYPVTVNAISGYTGGGRAMIAEFEAGGPPYRAYGLGQTHKHLPEMRHHAGLDHPPVFTPAVGDFAQGMLVEVPLAMWSLPGTSSLDRVHAALASAYRDTACISVAPAEAAAATTGLEPEACNGTNRLELFVFGNDVQARLVARLDNLGKGAAGAAVQNLNLVLGVGDTTGLII
ncbi:MAG: N-acetyl-gamma-glutamyl-phosphate reductase [Pseudomonadota bacterium]